MNEELVKSVREALGNDTVSTSEAAARLEDLFGYRCPDDLAKTLIKMKKEGYIKGKVSAEAGGWIWWADGECRAVPGRD
ncbi:MAG: hypothetical protein ACOX8L_05470 [Candidatus Methanomethylophilaceae archaeon]